MIRQLRCAATEREPKRWITRGVFRHVAESAAILVCVALAVVFGYTPLKAGAVAALEVGTRAGYSLTEGAPGLESNSVRRQGAAGAAWLETMSRPQEADTASSHSGGLFRPAYTEEGDVRLPTAYREWIFVGGAL